MADYTKDIGIRDFYDHYYNTETRKGRVPRPYKQYAKLLRDINLELRRAILEEAAVLTLPYRLGTLGVYKFKVAYNPENTKNWKVDFKATKEAGHVVYYGSTYGYMWKWSKKHAKFKGKKWYNFKPCRTASRLIADAVNNKELDFYEYKHKEA